MGTQRGLTFIRWVIRTPYPYFALLGVVVVATQGFLPIVAAGCSVGIAALFIGAAWVQFLRERRRERLISRAESLRRSFDEWPGAAALEREGFSVGVGRSRRSDWRHVLIAPDSAGSDAWLMSRAASAWARDQFRFDRFATHALLRAKLMSMQVSYLPPSKYRTNLIAELWPWVSRWIASHPREPIPTALLSGETDPGVYGV
ncbi:UNVERIFIED_CONTAM: hypothetical protein OHV15_13005 [Microbacterium sp. SLM126]